MENNGLFRKIREMGSEVIIGFITVVLSLIAVVAVAAQRDWPIETRVVTDLAVAALNAIILVLLYFYRQMAKLTRLFPSTKLEGRVVKSYIDNKIRNVQEISEAFSKRRSYSVKVYEMYQELIQLTEIMNPHHRDRIIAVSSVNILAFLTEPYAADYLKANERAVSRGVPVHRIFLLEQHDPYDPRILELVNAHDQALSATKSHIDKTRSQEDKSEVRVKWFYKSEISSQMRNQDFAIFGGSVLVRQTAPPEEPAYSITLDEDIIRQGQDVFNELWGNDRGKTVKDLKLEHGKRHES